jgi:hypothetical protein
MGKNPKRGLCASEGDERHVGQIEQPARSAAVTSEETFPVTVDCWQL